MEQSEKIAQTGPLTVSWGIFLKIWNKIKLDSSYLTTKLFQMDERFKSSMITKPKTHKENSKGFYLYKNENLWHEKYHKV